MEKDRKNWFNDRWLAYQVANGKIAASTEKTQYLKKEFPSAFDGSMRPPPQKKNRVNPNNVPKIVIPS